MATTTRTPQPEPTSPLEEIARRELALIAPLLTDPRASKRLEDLADAGQLDPARARLAQRLVDASEPITLYLPLSEHASERIRDALVDAFVHRYGEENPPTLPWGPDELTALETLARAIADVCEAQQYAAIDWSTRCSARLEASTVAPAHTPTRPTSPATPDERPACRGTVKPATLAHLQAIRAEFADDPAGIDVLIALAQDRAEPAAAAAAPPSARAIKTSPAEGARA